MENLINDLSYGAKMLWKSKVVTIIAVISLAIGIGANSAIFSLLNSILLRPRAVSQPEQLVEIFVGEDEHPYQSTSYPSYLELRDRSEVFTGVAAYGISQLKLGVNDQVELIWGEEVSGNYFDVLGVTPYMGRTFAADEDLVPGQKPVAIVSHDLWQRRFNSDSELVGKTVTINEQQLTVVGVAPPQYMGMVRGLGIDVWIPLMTTTLIKPGGERALTSRGNRGLKLVGRLKPGATIEQARARFNFLTQEMRAAYPEEWLSKSSSGRVRESFITVLSESETRIPPDMQSIAWGLFALLFVIVNLVLLIACINLASMLLARAVTRRREMAVRLALGASRRRIVRQLLTESVLLSLIAGAAGILLAVWLLNLVAAFLPVLPEGLRIAVDIRLDWRVVLYTITFSTLTGILFGLAPALNSSKADVSTVLKNDSNMFTGLYRKSRGRMALVVVQVAFSLLLLITAGLVLRSLEKVGPTRLGFSSENMIVAPVELEYHKYDRAKSQEFFRQLSERVGSLPGVQYASLVDQVPGELTGGGMRGTGIEGYQPGPGEQLKVESVYAGPHYFTNMKVPFTQGRDFDERDREGAPCVAIVNQAFVQRYFANTAAPLGKHLTRYEGGAGAAKEVQCQIVGVMRDDEWHSLSKQVPPFFALALQQSNAKRLMLMVGTAGDPKNLVGAVRNVIRDLDRSIPVTDVQPLGEFYSFILFPFRMVAVVMGACGLFALLLAVLGIYGIVSYSVAQRTREVGIRMALGALRKDILRMVILQGMALVMAGLGFGLLLSLVVTQLLTSSLLELELPLPIRAIDPLTFVSVTALLALVALFACYIPARRATKVDPIEALRYE